jgi:16S rRNA (guanine966-N2)-methyltransferase
MARSGKSPVKQSHLRIIGGLWRGRKLTFTPADGLRPTPDRVRETLFNWLAPSIRGARCLDLFAGSGALGLEALSRGAGYCDFVDTSAAAIRQIELHLQTLHGGERACCHQGPALTFLQEDRACHDIVFIDPPFGKNLVDPICERLAGSGRVSAGGFIYIEMAAQERAPNVPSNWRLHREKAAGEVAYRLFEMEG